MHLREVLTDARSRHVFAFIERMDNLEPCHVEPAMRLSDGSLALAGNPPTPCRMDLVVKASGEQHTVESARPSQLAGVCAEVGATTVQVEPFDWSMARVEVLGAGPAACERVREWFVRWFDPDDENSADTSGLYGAVHYLGDVIQRDATTTFEVDLGSAPPTAAEDLVTILASEGASRIRIF